MKKVMSFVVILILTISLFGCKNNLNKGNNQPIIEENGKMVTELNLSSDQVSLLINNNIYQLVQTKDGFIIVHYEQDGTRKYITKFTNQNIEWSIGPYRNVYGLKLISDDEFTAMYCVALTDCSTAIFNIQGEELTNVTSPSSETILNEDGSIMAVEKIKSNNTKAYYHDYNLVKASRDKKIIIKSFENMVYANIKELKNGTFLVETRDINDKYSYLTVTEQGDIIYESDLPLRASISPLSDGLLIDDKLNDQIYKVNDLNEEIWRVTYDHYIAFVKEELKDSLIVYVKRSNTNQYLEINNDGTYEVLKNYEPKHSYKVFKEFDNGNTLTLSRDKLSMVNSNDELIWTTNSYYHILDLFIDGDYYYINTINQYKETSLIQIDNNGNEISQKDTNGKIQYKTSTGYIGVEDGNKAVLYNNNFEVLWKSKSYNHINSITETSSGNFIIEYPEHYSYVDPGSVITNYYTDLISSDGELIKSFKDAFENSSYLFSHDDYTYLLATDSVTDMKGNRSRLIKIDSSGKIISDDEILILLENNIYIIRDNKILRITYKDFNNK